MLRERNLVVSLAERNRPLDQGAIEPTAEEALDVRDRGEDLSEDGTVGEVLGKLERASEVPSRSREIRPSEPRLTGQRLLDHDHQCEIALGLAQPLLEQGYRRSGIVHNPREPIEHHRATRTRRLLRDKDVEQPTRARRVPADAMVFSCGKRAAVQIRAARRRQAKRLFGEVGGGGRRPSERRRARGLLERRSDRLLGPLGREPEVPCTLFAVNDDFREPSVERTLLARCERGANALGNRGGQSERDHARARGHRPRPRVRALA
jgi:hypothetical protein